MKATDKTLLINRELSWLEFNQRVLDEGMDPSVPLLEKVSFLAITASNLDEFFMVRVGGLQGILRQGGRTPDASGMTPSQQIERISDRCRDMVRLQYSFYRETLEPALAEAGIRRVTAEAVTAAERETLHAFFSREIDPVVSPMSVYPPPDFPNLVNLRLYVAARLAPARGSEEPRFAVLPLGANLPRLIPIPGADGFAYMLIEDVVQLFVQDLFPGERVEEAVPFRITRNADMSVREDQGFDLSVQMQEVLDERREGDCVRLEIHESASQTLTDFLRTALGVAQLHVYRAPSPLILSDLRGLCAIPGFETLRYTPWPPQPCPDLDLRRSLFEQLAERDVLLCHPYESFDPVVRFVEEAAADPEVLAIKQILYRTSSESPLVASLAGAAQRGKYVTAVVELKARFDESRNIEWARELEKAGVQVIYGVRGLKTHGKVCLVVRREPRGIVRYVHFGTGNYNERTARQYSDISFFTSDPDLGADASAFFHAITGYSEPREYRKISMAPMGLRERTLTLIQSEMERRRQGQPARIRAKMNNLVDPNIIQALYDASRAGVDIELNVRGICCLRPGVRGVSERIKVVSVIDRYLEHARIFYFHHGGEGKMFISSADWMQRNMDRRVELLVPVDNPACKAKLEEILDACFRDVSKARRLLPDGRYEPVAVGKRKPFRCQAFLYKRACDAARESHKARPRILKPHRKPGLQS